MDKKEIIPLGLILLMFAMALYFADRMPEKIIVHWNAEGQPDGYGGRLMGLYLLPLITLITWGLFYVIPKIEVIEFRKNIKKFEKHYFGFRVAFITFMLALYSATIAINLGHSIPMSSFMLIVLAVFFYYIGHIMQYVKRNFWIGFRTPWTISNENVWDKTHALGSKLFRAVAVIMLLAGFITPKSSMFWVIFLIAGSAVFIMVYSYVIYRRELEGNAR